MKNLTSKWMKAYLLDSCNSKSYKCCNLILKRVVESINVKIDQSGLLKTKKERKNIDILEDQIDIELK